MKKISIAATLRRTDQPDPIFLPKYIELLGVNTKATNSLIDPRSTEGMQLINSEIQIYLIAFQRELLKTLNGEEWEPVFNHPHDY